MNSCTIQAKFEVGVNSSVLRWLRELNAMKYANRQKHQFDNKCAAFRKRTANTTKYMNVLQIHTIQDNGSISRGHLVLNKTWMCLLLLQLVTHEVIEVKWVWTLLWAE